MRPRIELGGNIVAWPTSSPFALGVLVAIFKCAISSVSFLSIRITSLNHEARNDSMESTAIEKLLLAELQEALHMLWRHVVPHLELHNTLSRRHPDLRVVRRIGCERQDCGCRSCGGPSNNLTALTRGSYWSAVALAANRSMSSRARSAERGCRTALHEQPRKRLQGVLRAPRVLLSAPSQACAAQAGQHCDGRAHGWARECKPNWD
mmetsp:Transcript_90188/g.159737  ORF Transcript_90188/g.159737 Transcript_90188/m.159737 type:complete len:207 (-) Transcript_90188:38-658(-)